MDEFIGLLKQDFPSLHFKPNNKCYWSPESLTVFFNPKKVGASGFGAVLHELGHAVLNHSSYNSDLELLIIEVAAWEKAEELADKYNQKIDPDHIQSCLDTYRDWLHRRSTCPNCHIGSMQQGPTTYKCFNCGTIWKVTAARFCRPYRKIEAQKEKPLEKINSQTTLS